MQPLSEVLDQPPARPLNVATCLVYNQYYNINVSREMSATAIDVFFPGYKSLTGVQRGILLEYVNQKKIMGSRKIAEDVILGPADKRHSWSRKVGDKYEPVAVTMEDVDWTYAVGAGAGMDYEWPYE